MLPSGKRLRRMLGALGVVCLILTGLPMLAGPAADERTNVNVLVKDGETGQPIYQARITLQFRVNPGKLKRARTLSYSAKTNAQGRYKFTHIPKGTLRLLVTAERHQSFGKEFEVEEDNPLIEVTLRKPQPLL